MDSYNNYWDDYRNYKRVIVGKEIKTKTELEYRSELIKKIFEWLTYKLYKLHKKINYKYVEVEYEENIYEYKKVA